MTREEVEKEIGFSSRTILEDAGGQIRINEAVTLYSTADAIAPKVIVEIGANMGTSSTFLGLVAKKHGGKLYSIERKPLSEWYENIKKYGVSDFTKLLSEISPHIDKARLPFSVIDYLLIDGDHSYESVLADYLFWQPMVRPDGIIAFHDYLVSEYGIKRAVTEILLTNELEFIALAGETETEFVPIKGETIPERKLGLIVFKKV